MKCAANLDRIVCWSIINKSLGGGGGGGGLNFLEAVKYFINVQCFTECIL